MATLVEIPTTSLFSPLPQRGPDALLGLIALHAADPRPHKIDLGVGVFRDAHGATPIMAAIKRAEAILLAGQTSKSYLGADGDTAFVERLARVALGPVLANSASIFGIQTPGGTGALRLGAELLAQAAPGATVWIGNPSWPNHAPLMHESKLTVRSHGYYDRNSGSIGFDRMVSALRLARRGDIVLLHGCCHNPTGADLTAEQWATLAGLCADEGLIPFIDLAYQGLGNGLESDAQAMRVMLAAVPEALVAYSCDKNFGLYRERTGALWVQTASPAVAERTRGNALALARCLWSMPPDHGAALVRIILEDATLDGMWREELDGMRMRINDLRAELALAHPRLSTVASQRGMFALLPIAPDAVVALARDHGIYMAPDGRINIAGLTPASMDRFVDAVAPYLHAPEGS